MEKPRIIITTDMEVDDMNSMIHLAPLFNEFDLRGIVYTSSQYHFNGDGIHTLGQITPHYRCSGEAGFVRPRTVFGPDPDGKNLKAYRPFEEGWLENLWKNEYAQAYPYLIQHADGYPTVEELLSLTKYGNIEFEGDVRYETEGSQLIEQELLKDDPKRLYLLSWGGVNTIVRSLLSIKDKCGSEEQWKETCEKISRNTVILGVANGVGQDNSYLDNRIDELYPNLKCLRTEYFYGVYFSKQMSSKPIASTYTGAWLKEHILFNHGDLMSKYFTMGDGRRYPNEPDVDQFGLHPVIDFGHPGSQPVYFDQYDFLGEGDSNTFFPLISFGLRGLESENYPTLLGKLSDKPTKVKEYDAYSGKEGYFNPFETVIQDEFAARAEWCCKDYKNANHPPVITVDAYDLSAKAGETIELSAKVSDPDGQQVALHWEHYEKFDTYQGIGKIAIWQPWLAKTFATIPEDAKANDEFVFILRAQDICDCPMTRFAQICVHVK